MMTVIKITSTLNKLIDNNPELQTLEANTNIIDLIDAYSIQFDIIKNKHDELTALSSVYDAMERIEPDPSVKDRISCRKGCAHCCHINVNVNQLEVDLIKVYCYENDIPIDKEYLEKQKDLTIKSRPFSDYSACVFLAENNTCKIYKVRPTTCRNYFVVSPPDECNAREYPNKLHAQYPNIDLEIIASALSTKTGDMQNMIHLLLK